MRTIDDVMLANMMVAILLDLDFRGHVKSARIQNGVGDWNAASRLWIRMFDLRGGAFGG